MCAPLQRGGPGGGWVRVELLLLEPASALQQQAQVLAFVCENSGGEEGSGSNSSPRRISSQTQPQHTHTRTGELRDRRRFVAAARFVRTKDIHCHAMHSTQAHSMHARTARIAHTHTCSQSTARTRTCEPGVVVHDCLWRRHFILRWRLREQPLVRQLREERRERVRRGERLRLRAEQPVAADAGESGDAAGAAASRALLPYFCRGLPVNLVVGLGRRLRENGSPSF